MRALTLTLALGAFLLSPTIRAEAPATMSVRDALGSFFPGSQRVTYRKIGLSPEDQERISQRLGYRFTAAEVTVYVALTGEKIDGYAVVDEEMGQHLPITFGVKISPSGTVERSEILCYRETYGAAVREERFNQQFAGKSATDPLRPGSDIVIVSGATISSHAVAKGVKRALVTVDELVLHKRSAERASPKTRGGS